MDVRVRCVAYHNEKLVMIHRISPKRPDGYYIFPGGGVDLGETPEEACVREMLEETNLVVTPTKLLGMQFHRDSNGDHCQMYYLVSVISGEFGPGNGFEYTPEYTKTVGGTHDPVLIAPKDLSNLNLILPAGIDDVLAAHNDEISEIPFFIIDNLPSVC